ncbi:DNRLRE domain-containing protein [Paenibacillus sepulcri]|uniref:DNRLRE domain-containing protein n=1 Tax=Paenibacillus sepulcri TaxID=359917 RepID=A0ABS7BXW1_9BACL|nr:DNRLRE domain-containing protein [Paenibacillus sepulcri]
MKNIKRRFVPISLCLILSLLLTPISGINASGLEITPAGGTPDTSVEREPNEPDINFNGLPESSLSTQAGGAVDSKSFVTKVSVPTDIMARASKAGKSVVGEAVNRRNANSRHYQLSDGSYMAEISMSDQNFLDASGNWQPINTNLVDEANLDLINIPISHEAAASINQIVTSNKQLRETNKINNMQSYYRAPQVPFDVKLPKKFDNGYSIGKGSEQLSFKPLHANSVIGAVYGNKIEYPNAWEYTDLQLEVKNSGIKETIILKNNQAPTTFQFQLNSDIRNSRNFELLPAWLIDANGTKRDVAQTLNESDGHLFVQLDVDTTGLQFPVFVDPTVMTVTSSQDASCDEYGCDSGNSSYDANDYFTIGSWSSSYNSYTVHDGYFQYDLSSIPLHSSISSAVMGLYIFSGYTTISASGVVYRLTSNWNENTIQPSSIPSHDPTSIPTNTGPYGVENSWERPGWMNTDITSFAQLWADGTPNYGVVVQVGGLQTGKNIYSHEYSVTEYQPKITITYNSPPILAPAVTSPNGGETIDSSYNITWNAAVDPDNTQNTLRYHIQLSTDGGNNWADIAPLTDAGMTSYSYNFSSAPQSTNAFIRIRAYDGSLYGPWDQSNAVFAIKHNHAPNAPTALSPGSTSSSTPSVTLTNPILNWTFTDPDAGNTQSAYEVQIYSGTTLIRDSGWVTSSVSSYTVPAPALTRGTTYYWKVSTQDNKGTVSSFSVPYYFRINTLPVATVTSYTNGQQMTGNILQLTWTYSDANSQVQTKYQIQGTQDNWATVAYDSGLLSGSATSFTTPALANGTWSFKVLTFDGMEWSSPAYRNNLVLPNTFEPNDSFVDAFPINYNQTYTSLISLATDLDFYKYTPTKSGANRIMLNAPAGLNYDIFVFDSAYNLVSSGIRAAGLQENQLFDVTAGQTYYFLISGTDGSKSTSAPYSFILSPYNQQTQTIYQYDSNGNITSKTTTITN